MDERMKRVSRRQKAVPLAICSRDICTMIFVEDSFADSLLFSRATDNTKLMPRFNYNGQKFVYYPRNNRPPIMLRPLVNCLSRHALRFSMRVRSSDSSNWNTCSRHIVMYSFILVLREIMNALKFRGFLFLFKNRLRWFNIGESIIESLELSKCLKNNFDEH